MQPAEGAGEAPRKERKSQARPEGEAEARRVPLRGKEEEHDDGGKGERFEPVCLASKRPRGAEHAAHQRSTERRDGKPAEGAVPEGKQPGRDPRKAPELAEEQHRRPEQHADVETRDGKDVCDAALAHRLFEPLFDDARAPRKQRIGERCLVAVHIPAEYFVQFSVEAKKRIGALRRGDEFPHGHRVADVGGKVVPGIGAPFKGIALFGRPLKDDEIARHGAVGGEDGAALPLRPLAVEKEIVEHGDGIPLPFGDGEDGRRHGVLARRQALPIARKGKVHEPCAHPRKEGHDEKEGQEPLLSKGREGEKEQHAEEKQKGRLPLRKADAAIEIQPEEERERTKKEGPEIEYLLHGCSSFLCRFFGGRRRGCAAAAPSFPAGHSAFPVRCARSR